MNDESDRSPLTGDDLATWAALATVLEWLPPALDAGLARDVDLTHFEYGILYALATSPERTLRMSVLAGYANSSLSRLSRAATRLEGRGWISRTRDPADGRSTLALLTAQGLEVFENATPVHEQNVRALVLDPLTSAQKQHLRAISRRIQQAISANDGWAPR